MVELPVIKNPRAPKGSQDRPIYPDSLIRRRCLITSNSYFGGSADIPAAVITDPFSGPSAQSGLVPLALRPRLSAGLLLSVVAYNKVMPQKYNEGLCEEY